MPEVMWKAYIDFEVGEGEREIARGLYERLVALSGHVKVWIAYALFEVEDIPLRREDRDEEEEEAEEAEPKTQLGDVAMARHVFERGYKDLKDKGLKSEVNACFRLLFASTDTFSRSVWLCSKSGRHSRKSMVPKRM